MAKTECFDPAEFPYRIAVLKATNKLAKIPTSAILEEEQKESRSLYSNYMKQWPKIQAY